jgi:hypothetical protein
VSGFLPMASIGVTQDESRLIRGMGPWALTAFAINATLGSGIFGLPAKLDGTRLYQHGGNSHNDNS